MMKERSERRENRVRKWQVKGRNSVRTQHATNKQETRRTLSVLLQLRFKQELTHFHRHRAQTGTSWYRLQPPDRLQGLFQSSPSAECWVGARGGCGSAGPGFKEKRRSVSLLAVTGRRIRSLQRYLHPPSSSFILPPPPSSSGPTLLSEWSGVIYSLCEALEQVSGPEKWSCGVI